MNVAVPAPETIEEFKVQTSLYDATFGRGAGGNVQTITKISESKNIQFRAEFFNLFNHVNLANPVSNFNAVPSSSIDPTTGRIINASDLGDFGRINSTSNNPRLIQLAIKFNY